MSDKSSCVFLMCAMFALGFGVGKQEVISAQKEVVKLEIELTKLRIKELKAN